MHMKGKGTLRQLAFHPFAPIGASPPLNMRRMKVPGTPYLAPSWRLASFAYAAITRAVANGERFASSHPTHSGLLRLCFIPYLLTRLPDVGNVEVLPGIRFSKIDSIMRLPFCHKKCIVFMTK